MTSFIALFLYSLLPILRNTITGLEGIDHSVLEAAKGMGLTPRQVLATVQLPLAWPVILAGIRVSSMLIVGIAAIATLVAGGGLGNFIKDGLARLPLPNSLESIWTGTALCVQPRCRREAWALTSAFVASRAPSDDGGPGD